MQQDLIWYVSYGSNMSWKRFNLYIQGGYLNTLTRTTNHLGCTDKSPPIKSEKLEIRDFELVFSRKSQRWGGGVGFLQKYPKSKVFARKYLVTRSQFVQIMLQECGYGDYTHQNKFEEKLMEITSSSKDYGVHELVEGSLYGDLIFLDRCSQGIPRVTFTNSSILAFESPSTSYLATISQGLIESGHVKDLKECVSYLSTKKGVEDDFEKLYQNLDDHLNK